MSKLLILIGVLFFIVPTLAVEPAVAQAAPLASQLTGALLIIGGIWAFTSDWQSYWSYSIWQANAPLNTRLMA